MPAADRPRGLRRALAFAKTIVLILAITAMMAVAANFALSFFFGMPVAREDWHAFRRAVSDARKEGRDWRNPEEVLAECRPSGCRPYVNPLELRMRSDAFWPVALRPQSALLYCNEGGFWKFVDTDRYGFDANPDAAFSRSDIVLVGDSFGTGACVGERSSIAGILRARGLEVLNLSAGGYQVLDELAAVKEYASPAETLVWLYFEGNDHYPAVNQSFLRNYLQPDSART